jgi:ArsR family transcriptional regulator, arsenate/arsenite/antimonite-responsive transcriptional repressor
LYKSLSYVEEVLMATQSCQTDGYEAANAVNGCQVEPRASLKILPADEEIARLARALAHPARVAIMRHLLQLGECVCTDLSGVVPLAHSTAMQHIKILKESGLLQSSRDGRNVLYCVDPESVLRLKGLIDRL